MPSINYGFSPSQQVFALIPAQINKNFSTLTIRRGIVSTVSIIESNVVNITYTITVNDDTQTHENLGKVHASSLDVFQTLEEALNELELRLLAIYSALEG